VFVEEMTGAYAGLPLVPLVAWLVFRYPIAANWKRRLLPYVGAGAVYSLLYTTSIHGLRLFVFAAIGRGVYDYGLMHVRYFMEMSIHVILFATIVVVITYVEERRTRQERELRMEVLARELTQAQLQALQLQLQPHFLFNAFNAISAVMYEDPHIADRMISRLSDFLRAILRSDKTQEVRLQEELDLLNLYLDVMKARFEDRLQFSVSCGRELASAFVPQLVLQPIVENAIRYGVDPRTGMIDVAIQAHREDGQLRLQVTDRGPGERAGPGNGLGLGLKNIHARLEHLYGESASLSIEHNGGGTRVLIILPYHREPLVSSQALT
jgi:two-component system, LytTR family, sensor kinase